MSKRGWAPILALFGVGCGGADFSLHDAPPLPAPGAHTIAIVRVHAPWYAPRFAIVGKFRDAIPEYERIVGLDNKYFSISDQRDYGGIYDWQSRAQAEAYYSDAWRSGIRARRGVEPELTILDAPFSVSGRASPRGEPVGRRALRYPAAAALVTWISGAERATETLLDNLRSLGEADETAFMRAYVVATVHRGERRVGVFGVWPSAAQARRALSQDSLAVLTRGLALSEAESTAFEVPILIDGELRAASEAGR
jgi:hypothetical protein